MPRFQKSIPEYADVLLRVTVHDGVMDIYTFSLLLDVLEGNLPVNDGGPS